MTACTSEDTVIEKIRKDYSELAGKIIELPAGRWIYGYWGNTDDSGDVRIQTPIKVRIDSNATDCDLLRYMGQGWIDPVYSVEIVEGNEQTTNLRSCWIDGKSYNYITGEVQ
jgi:hypothetical protein